MNIIMNEILMGNGYMIREDNSVRCVSAPPLKMGLFLNKRICSQEKKIVLFFSYTDLTSEGDLCAVEQRGNGKNVVIVL